MDNKKKKSVSEKRQDAGEILQNFARTEYQPPVLDQIRETRLVFQKKVQELEQLEANFLERSVNTVEQTKEELKAIVGEN